MKPARIMKATELVLILAVMIISLGTAKADHHKALRAEIVAAEAKWTKAWNARDIDTLMKLYSKDVKGLYEDGLVEGLKAVRKHHEQILKELGELDVVEQDIVLDVVGQGNYATEIGKYIERDRKTKEITDQGNWMTVWKKEDGEWKMLWEAWIPLKKEEAKATE